MFLRRRTNLVIVLTILMACTARAQNVTCNRQCGKQSLQFPFGFSEGCEIRLNCFDNQVQIYEFLVQNVTDSNIFVNLPGKCNRRMESIEPLFQSNFAPSVNNSFLVQNCSEQFGGCVIPASNFGESCDKKSGNISCFSKQDGADVVKYTDLNGTKCKYLFSAVSFGQSNETVLQFQVVELGWWLHGQCDECSDNSTCTPVPLQGGFRCQCIHGFTGDGFRMGTGCRKTSASSCSASTLTSGGCGKATKIGVAVGAIIAGALVMAGLFLLCYCARRRSIWLGKHTRVKRQLREAAGNSSIPFYPYKEVEKATNSFSEKHRLGTGAFGTVYAGKLHNDEWVAIKKLRQRDTNSADQVMNEIKLLTSVSHPNLVRLLGCCVEKGEQILVYEFMQNGTLSQHLQRERSEGLPWTVRLTIATETANAIAYLHSEIHPPIYHRDIKSSNILLDYQFKSKIADFGLSRLGLTETSHISTAPQGTPGYVDPQYHQNFHLSDKSDVYSFGVVLVEIITAMKAVDFSRPRTEVNLAALAVDRIRRGAVDEIIDPFLEPHRDAWTLYSIHKVAELAFRCLAFHSDMRPTMMEVAEELEHIKRSGWASMEETATANGVAHRDKVPPLPPPKDQVEKKRRDSEGVPKSSVSSTNGQAPPPPPPPPPGRRAPSHEDIVDDDGFVSRHSHMKYELRDSPGLVPIGVYGIQHYVSILGSLILVPLVMVPAMGGSREDTSAVVSTVLFVSGMTTLLHSNFGSRLPLIQGSSFVYLAPALAIINSSEFQGLNENKFKHIMKELQGAIIIGSAFQAFLGYTGLMSLLVRLINPVVVSPTIAAVGLSFYSYGFPLVGTCLEIGAVQILVVIVFSLYLRKISVFGHRIFLIYAVPLGLAITWAVAFLLTEAGVYNYNGCDINIPASNMISEHCRKHVSKMKQCRVDTSYALEASPWFRFPYPLQWGTPVFHWKMALVMCVVSLISSVDSVGSYHASSLLVASRPPTPGVLSRGIGLEGLSSVLAGLWGTGTGATTLTENVHTIAVTKMGSRRAIQLGACFLIVLSLVGKVGGFIASIPEVMVAGLLCFMWAMLTALGLSNLRYSEAGSSRNIIIIGLSLFFSLSIPAYFQQYGISPNSNSSVPSYFQPYIVASHGPFRTQYGGLNYFLNTTFSLHMVVAFLVAVILDNTVPGSKQERGVYVWSETEVARREPAVANDYELPLRVGRIFRWVKWVGL